MFIKNDNLHKLEKTADRKEHFGIRKLTIGTASVLIGVSLYFDSNLNMVKADIQQPNKESLQSKAGNDNSAEMLAQEQKDKTGKAGEKSALEDIKKGKTQKQSLKVDDQSNPNESDQTNISKQSQIKTDKDDNNTLSLSNLKKGSIDPKKEEALLAGSKAEDKGHSVSSPDNSITLTVNHDNYHATSGESEIITLNVGGVAGKQTIEAGDTITFTIPVGDYQLGNVQSLSADIGNTELPQTANNKEIIIKDIFKEIPPQNINQSISLDPYDLWQDWNSYAKDEDTFFDPNKKVNVQIVDKNGRVRQSLNIGFKQIISPSIQVNMWRTKPSLIDGEKQALSVNHDYTWYVAVNQNTDMHLDGTYRTGQNIITKTFSSAITDNGTTITVDVPDSFVLNQAATQALLNNRECPVTVSQAGKGQKVVFHINKNSGSYRLDNGNEDEEPYYFIGQFQMEQPDNDTTVEFKSHADQKLLHDLGELKGDATWTETILGKNNPNQGPSTAEMNIQLHGYRTDNKLPLDFTKKLELNHGQFQNDNSQDLTNATITLNVADGFDATSFFVPAMGNMSDYDYTVTFVDGSSQNGTTIAGTATFTKAIAKIVIKGVNVPAGAGTGEITSSDGVNSGGITIYGTIAKKYRNGADVKAGDSFTSDLSLTAENLTGAPLTSSDTQTVDDHLPGPVTKIYADVYYSQSNYGPDHTNAGTISIEFTQDPQAIVYFLVPENAVYHLPANHDGISFLKIGNRDVVKFTKAGIEGRASITLDNTKPAVTSMKPIYVYLVSGKKNAVIGTSEGENGFDPDPIVGRDQLSFVEGNKNARFVAGEFGSSWPKYYWKVMPVLTTGNHEAAQGNQDDITRLHGISEIHDAGGHFLSSDMSFYTEIVNTSPNRMTDVISVTNLPQTNTVIGLNKGQFKFNLNEDGVTVLGFENGELISINPEVRYSYQVANLHNDVNFDEYLTASEITDWSKVKAVAVRIAQIDSNERIQIHMKGKDRSFNSDAGKIAYLSSRTQGGGISKPFIILPGPDNALSASIEILDNGDNPNQPTEPSKTQPTPTPVPTPEPGTKPIPTPSQPTAPSTTPIKPTQPRKPTTPTQPKTPHRPGRKTNTSSNNKSHSEQFRTKHYNSSFRPHNEKFDQSRTKTERNNWYSQNVIKRTNKTTNNIVSNNSVKQSTTLPHTGLKKSTSLFVIGLSLLGLGLSAWFETKRKHG